MKVIFVKTKINSIYKALEDDHSIVERFLEPILIHQFVGGFLREGGKGFLSIF